MQPLGRKHNPCAEDCHPGKGWMNWWEDVVNPSKKSARQKAKRDIKEEIRNG